MQNSYANYRNMNERYEAAPCAGIWHYIQTFCAFFSMLATLSFIGVLTHYRSTCIPYLFAIWILGVIAGILVSPGKFFFFGFSIIGTIAKYAWFVLPFPIDIIPFLLAVPFSLVLVLALMIIVPCLFTIHTYFDDIKFDSTDDKKERIAIAAGIGAALILFGAFLGMNVIGKAVESPAMESAFDPYEIFETYMEDNGETPVYLAAGLEDPVSVEEREDGYVRECYFEFEQYDDNLYSEYKVWITYDWYNEEWNIVDIREEIAPITFTSVTGTWYGVGTFPMNASYGNAYTCNLTFTPEGGSGTIDVVCGSKSYHLDIVSIEMGEMRNVTSTYMYEEEYGSLQDMKLILGETLSLTSWGTEYTYSDIECVYSFDSNAISFHSFAPRFALVPQQNEID